MGIGDDPNKIINKLWEQYAVHCCSSKLKIDNDKMRLEIKTKVPKEVYGDAISIAENKYRLKEGDAKAKIPPRQLMKVIPSKCKDLQKEKNEVSLLNIYQSQERAKMGKMKKGNNKIDGSDNNEGSNNDKFTSNCHFCGNKGHKRNECRKWKADCKKTCNIFGKKGHSGKYCRSNKNNQNSDHSGAWQNSTRCVSRADDKASSYANVECVLSNFDDDFSFVEFKDACSYDGDNYDSNHNFDNEDFLFPTNVVNALLSAELSDVVPQMNQINPIKLIKNPYGIQSMVNLLNKDHDENYGIDDDVDDVDDDSVPGLEQQPHYKSSSGDDHKSDEESSLGTIPGL